MAFTLASACPRKRRSSSLMLALSEEDARSLLEQIRCGLAEEIPLTSVPDVVDLLATLRSSLKNPDNMATIIRADFVPLLKECFTKKDVQVQRSAMWALCILARDDSDLRGQCIPYLPLLVQLLELDSSDRCFQADCLRLVANMVGDGAAERDAFLDVVPYPGPLLGLITKLLQPELLQEIACLMCSIAEHGAPSNLSSSGRALRDTVFVILNSVLSLITSCDCWVIRDVCRAFLNTLRLPTTDAIEMVEAGNVVRLLVWHSTRSPADMRCTRTCFSAIIQLVVMLFHGDNATCQRFIDQGALRVLSIVIEEDRSELFYHICVAIANVFACDSPQIQCAIDHGLLTEAIRQLEHGDLRIQREAGFALGSFLDGACKEQVLQAFEQGLVPPLIQQLQSYDAEIVFDTLVSFFKLMHHGITLSKGDEFLQEMIEFDIEAHIVALEDDENEIIVRLAKHFHHHFLRSEKVIQHR